MNYRQTIANTRSGVTSRLDYCNALLYGLPETLLQKLQRVQNAAARLVTGTRKYEHITPVLKELHWLPIKQRIEYKILLLTFKALMGQAPEYISDLVKPYQPTRSLRSQSQHLLCEPKTRLSKYGNRSFGKAAAVLWNKMPKDLRKLPWEPKQSTMQFKSSLKTYLFTEVFSKTAGAQV